MTAVPGGMPGTAGALVAGVQALPGEVTSWSAPGIGRAHLPVVAAALSMGGHLRVGMEDDLMYGRGRPVNGNVELVERAARFARKMQRPPLTTDQARRLLGIADSRAAIAVG